MGSVDVLMMGPLSADRDPQRCADTSRCRARRDNPKISRSFGALAIIHATLTSFAFFLRHAKAWEIESHR